MSLRFLTRRRDRDRSPHRPTTTNSSTSTTTSAPANVALPTSNTNAHSLTKGKLAVPAEVQIISWDPRDLALSLWALLHGMVELAQADMLDGRKPEAALKTALEVMLAGLATGFTPPAAAPGAPP